MHINAKKNAKMSIINTLIVHTEYNISFIIKQMIPSPNTMSRLLFALNFFFKSNF